MPIDPNDSTRYYDVISPITVQLVDGATPPNMFTSPFRVTNLLAVGSPRNPNLGPHPVVPSTLSQNAQGQWQINASLQVPPLNEFYVTDFYVDGQEIGAPFRVIPRAMVARVTLYNSVPSVAPSSYSKGSWPSFSGGYTFNFPAYNGLGVALPGFTVPPTTGSIPTNANISGNTDPNYGFYIQLLDSSNNVMELASINKRALVGTAKATSTGALRGSISITASIYQGDYNVDARSRLEVDLIVSQSTVSTTNFNTTINVPCRIHLLGLQESTITVSINVSGVYQTSSTSPSWNVTVNVTGVAAGGTT
jgi:hypothetical protein